MRAKKGGGDRIIGISPGIARLWSMCREDAVQEWNKECFAHWGAAAKGNSALREAYQRALHEELAAHVQTSQAHGLLDVAQFYGSIEWCRLGEEALEVDFPAEVLGLEILQCTAPRVLTQSGA
eukprot:3270716-Pyramimonas_sp.AAC.1